MEIDTTRPRADRAKPIGFLFYIDAITLGSEMKRSREMILPKLERVSRVCVLKHRVVVKALVGVSVFVLCIGGDS